MNGNISAAQLRKAALEAEDRMLAELDTDEASPHEFSEAFKEKMRPLLKKARRQEKSRQTARAVLASIAVVLIIGLIWAATNADARNAVRRWFTYRHTVPDMQTGIEINMYAFTGESAGAMRDYRPGWVPGGYRETEVYRPDGYCSVTYGNGTGDMFIFYYFEMDDGTDMGIAIMPGEEVTVEHVRINGLPGDLYVSSLEGESNNLVWMDEENGVVFGIDAIMDPDVILQIAESVAVVEPR